MRYVTTQLTLLAAPPDPGGGIAPPGSDKIVTVISWVAWVAFAACVVGILIAGIMMALQHSRGQASEHAGRVGWVLGACILIGSASGLVGFFTA